MICICAIAAFVAVANAADYTVTGTETNASGSFTYDNLQIGVSDTAELNVTGASYTVSGATNLGYNANGNGTVNLTSGELDLNGINVGYNGTGSLNINGGIIKSGNGGSDFALGCNAGSYGAVTLNSGTFSSTFGNGNFVVGAAGTGVLTINGGVFDTNYLMMGGAETSNSKVVVNGGSVTIEAALEMAMVGGSNSLEINNHALMTIATVYQGYPGSTANSAITINSGTLVNENTMYLMLAGTNSVTLADEGTFQVGDGTGTINMGFADMPSYGGVNTLNLGTGGTSGGVLAAGAVSCGSGTGTVNFNFTGTNSYNQTFSGNLSVNKLGSGKTILTGSNSYTGLTTVNSGEMDVNGSLLASGSVQVKSGARLGGSGTVGNVNVTGGVVAPGNSPGTLTVTSLTLDSASTLEMQIAGKTAGSFDQIVASDFVSLSGTLALTGLDLLSAGDILTLIDVAGSTAVSGAFSAIKVQGMAIQNIVYTGSSSTFVYENVTYEVNYKGGDGNDVTLSVETVPEPATWAMAIGGLGMLLLVQSRRYGRRQ